MGKIGNKIRGHLGPVFFFLSEFSANPIILELSAERCFYMAINGMTHILPEKEGSIVNVFNVLEYNQFKCQGEQEENELFIIYRNEKGEKKVHSIKDAPV